MSIDTLPNHFDYALRKINGRTLVLISKLHQRFHPVPESPLAPDGLDLGRVLLCEDMLRVSEIIHQLCVVLNGVDVIAGLKTAQHSDTYVLVQSNFFVVVNYDLAALAFRHISQVNVLGKSPDDLERMLRCTLGWRLETEHELGFRRKVEYLKVPLVEDHLIDAAICRVNDKAVTIAHRVPLSTRLPLHRKDALIHSYALLRRCDRHLIHHALSRRHPVGTDADGASTQDAIRLRRVNELLVRLLSHKLHDAVVFR